MKKIFCFFWMIPFLAIFPLSLHARTPRDILTPLSILKSGVSARALGMGNAMVTVDGDYNSIYYNPAGLSTLKEQQFHATYQKVFESQTLDMENISFAFPFLNRIGLGAQFLFLNATDIQSSIIMNETGKTPSPFAINDFTAQLSAGGFFMKSIAVGGSLKFLQSKINDGNASTVGGDFGLIYFTPWKPLRVGLSVRNLGGQVNYETRQTPLPLTLSYGATWNSVRFPLVATIQGIKVKNEQAEWNIGGEYTWRNHFFLRLGYDSKNTGRDFINGGVGFRWRSYQLDYAYVPYREWGRTHVFSGTVHFGSVEEPPSPAAYKKKHIRKSKGWSLFNKLKKKSTPVKKKTVAAASPTVPVIPAPSKKEKTAEDYFAEGDYLRAAEFFEKDVKLDRDNPGLRYNLATSYFLAQSYWKSLEEYQQVVRIQPDDVSAHLYMGYAYYYLNRPDNARVEWKTVLRLDPSNTAARENLDNMDR